jgi:hypothetical protein
LPASPSVMGKAYDSKFTFVGVGAAVFRSKFNPTLEGVYIMAKYLMVPLGGLQCNVQFGYQLSSCSGTKDRVGRTQDLPDAN